MLLTWSFPRWDLNPEPTFSLLQRRIEQICFNVEGGVEKTGLERQGLLVVTGSCWSRRHVAGCSDLRRVEIVSQNQRSERSFWRNLNSVHDGAH